MPEEPARREACFCSLIFSLWLFVSKGGFSGDPPPSGRCDLSLSAFILGFGGVSLLVASDPLT